MNYNVKHDVIHTLRMRYIPLSEFKLGTLVRSQKYFLILICLFDLSIVYLSI